jgi:hypothetical protein
MFRNVMGFSLSNTAGTPRSKCEVFGLDHRMRQKVAVNVYSFNPRGKVNAGSMRYELSPLTRFRARAHNIRSFPHRQHVVASPVVTQQKAAMVTMETDAILNLFILGDTSTVSVDELLETNTGEIRQKRSRSILDTIGVLCDESKFPAGFDPNTFLANHRQ